MKTKHFLLSFSLVICLFACTNPSPEVPRENPTTPKTEEITTPDTPPKKDTIQEEPTQKPQTDSTKMEDPKLAYLKTFVPDSFELFHYYEGDLNRDERKNDVILIAHKPGLEQEQTGESIPRPCLILTRNNDGTLKLEARNDHAVLCSECGGAFGDPYDGVTIRNGYFSTEHYGGSSWRWTQINTFKYDEDKKDWFLHKTGGEHFHSSEPEKTEEEVKTTKDFGIIRFKDFE